MPTNRMVIIVLQRGYVAAVIQGAFILAKAQHGASVAAECLDHLRRYLELLFNRSKPREQSP